MESLLVDEVQASRFDSSTSCALVVAAVIALFIHLAPIVIEELL
jgi:hypothetical protein